MNPARAGLTDSRNTPRFRRFNAPATASGESPVGGDGNVPLSTGDAFAPRELAAWQGLLEVHAHVLRQLDLQMRAAHGLTLSQSEVLIFLDDAPDQRVRTAQLATEGAVRLLFRVRLNEIVDRLVEAGREWEDEYSSQHPPRRRATPAADPPDPAQDPRGSAT